MFIYVIFTDIVMRSFCCVCLPGDLLGISSRESKKHASGSNLERRHSVLGPRSPTGRSSQEFNYVPYSVNTVPTHAATLGHSSPTPQEVTQPYMRQLSSDINLNRINPAMYNALDNGATSRYETGQRQAGRRSVHAEVQIAPTRNPTMVGHITRERSMSAANLYAGGVNARPYGQVVQSIPNTGLTNHSTVISTVNSSIPTPAQVALQQRYTQVASKRPVSEVYYHTPVNTPANYLPSANNHSAYQTPVLSNYQTPSNGLSNYQTPRNGITNYQTPSNGIINYQTPSNGITNYQTPGNGLINYQTPVTRHTNGATSNVETHYKALLSDRRSPQARMTSADVGNPSDIPIAYSVVGVGSIASQSRLSGKASGDTRSVQANNHIPITSDGVISSSSQMLGQPMNGQRLAVQPTQSMTRLNVSQQGRPREVIQLPASPTSSMGSGGYDIPIAREFQGQQQHFQTHLTTQQPQRNNYQNVQQQVPQQGMLSDSSSIGKNGQALHLSLQEDIGMENRQVSPSHSKSKVSPVPPQTSLHGLREVQAFSAPTHDGSTPTNTGQPINLDVSIEGNTQTHSSPQFQPASKQVYDTLPALDGGSSTRDSLASEASSVSLTAELEHYTDAMMKALEQFDSLLQPLQETDNKEQFIQTSL